MSEIDITFDVTEKEFKTFQQQYAAQHEEQKGYYQSRLIESTADNVQFIVNRIRLEDGMWEPDPEQAKISAEYMRLFEEKLGETIGHFGVDLESRDSKIRF